jgi:hypothetical protein
MRARAPQIIFGIKIQFFLFNMGVDGKKSWVPFDKIQDVLHGKIRFDRIKILEDSFDQIEILLGIHSPSMPAAIPGIRDIGQPVSTILPVKKRGDMFAVLRVGGLSKSLLKNSNREDFRVQSPGVGSNQTIGDIVKFR